MGPCGLLCYYVTTEVFQFECSNAISDVREQIDAVTAEIIVIDVLSHMWQMLHLFNCWMIDQQKSIIFKSSNYFIVKLLATLVTKKKTAIKTIDFFYYVKIKFLRQNKRNIYDSSLLFVSLTGEWKDCESISVLHRFLLCRRKSETIYSFHSQFSFVLLGDKCRSFRCRRTSTVCGTKGEQGAPPFPT